MYMKICIHIQSDFLNCAVLCVNFCCFYCAIFDLKFKLLYPRYIFGRNFLQHHHLGANLAADGILGTYDSNQPGI